MNVTEEEVVRAIADGSSSPFVRAVLPKLVEQWRRYRALVERVAEAGDARAVWLEHCDRSYVTDGDRDVPSIEVRCALEHEREAVEPALDAAIDACRETAKEKK